MSVDDQTLSKWYINESLKDPLMLQSHALIKKRICIMGACGQMGSHIVTKLYELGLPSSSLMLNDCLSLGSVPHTILDLYWHLPAAFVKPDHR